LHYGVKLGPGAGVGGQFVVAALELVGREAFQLRPEALGLLPAGSCPGCAFGGWLQVRTDPGDLERSEVRGGTLREVK